MIEITPEKFRCSTVSPMCPAVFRLDNGDLVLIGKAVDSSAYEELRGRLSDDEIAIEIPTELVVGALQVGSDREKGQ